MFLNKSGLPGISFDDWISSKATFVANMCILHQLNYMSNVNQLYLFLTADDYTTKGSYVFHFYTLKLKGLSMGSYMTTARYLRTYCSITQIQSFGVNISYCHCAGYFLIVME